VSDDGCSASSAADIIRRLDLSPHPEGGHFRETFRDSRPAGGRSHSTALYFLLAAGERSAWHRIDATEIWHHYAGAPLRLSLSSDGAVAEHHRLGKDLTAGERPQIVIAPHCWQAAECLGAWTLVGCTVAPAFEFSAFEMAPADFAPEGSR
jgi:predicted cupin superfamily sugar epimerase